MNGAEKKNQQQQTTDNDDGRTGVLVESREPGAYARALDVLLAHPDQAEAMGVAAAARAGGFRWSTTAARLRRIYGDLALRTPTMC